LLGVTERVITRDNGQSLRIISAAPRNGQHPSANATSAANTTINRRAPGLSAVAVSQVRIIVNVCYREWLHYFLDGFVSLLLVKLVFGTDLGLAMAWFQHRSQIKQGP